MLFFRISRRFYCRTALQRTKLVVASPVINPQFRFGHLHSKFKHFSSSASVIGEAEKPKASSYLKIIGWTVVATIVAIPTLTSVGLYGYYYSLLEEAPVTKRKRILWRNAEFEEIISYTTSYPSTLKRPLVKSDAAEVVLVQKILDRFLGLDLVKGQVIKLFLCEIFEYPNAEAVSAVNGGKIFMDTGELLRCHNPDEVASIIAHELAHIVSKHSIESTTAHFCAKYINLLFNHRAPDGEDLPTKRVQEYEADHIGLLLLAEAGFDPQARLDYLERYLVEENELPDSGKEIPDFLRTHPSTQKRIKKLKTLLPHAMKIYKKQKRTKMVVDEWDSVRLDLQQRQLAAKRSLNYANMSPDQIAHVLLFAVDRLIGTVEELKHQISHSPPTNPDQIEILAATQQAQSNEQAGDNTKDEAEPIETSERDSSEKPERPLAAAQQNNATGSADNDENDESFGTSAEERTERLESVPKILTATLQTKAASTDASNKDNPSRPLQTKFPGSQTHSHFSS